MDILTLCLILTFCIVYIYDVVEFPRTFASRILSLIFKRKIEPQNVNLPKIFECSLCMVTWVTLILLLIFKPQYFYISFLYGWITKYVLYIFNTIDNLISLIFIILESILDKIRNFIYKKQ